MLDVSLRNLAYRYDGGFALRDVTVTFTHSTHTAVAGPPGCGASTLLRLIAGTLKPAAGEIVLGQRRVTDVKPAQRPLLLVTSALDVPGRWSVQHALVAAVRTRTLDRQDRHREYVLAAEKWQLGPLFERRVATLGSTEAARLQLARIELLRPAILLADRLLDAVSAAARTSLADAFYRTMRVFGTTVISVPSSHDELAFTDRVIVLENGAVIQQGGVAQVFGEPVNDAAAIATGDVDVVPVTIRGTSVASVIGDWEVDPPPFQGSGVALVRPADFVPAKSGEDSDLIFGVEEAGFADGRWIAHGVLSGGVTLRVELPRNAVVHKGRLIALRYDPTRFRLLPREMEPLQATVPTDVLPSMADSR
jgi:ABC-type Fe3+/spermidine/putrescine transport system ATPase subunit